MQSDIKMKLPKITQNNPASASIISKLNRGMETQSVNPLISNIPSIAIDTYEKIKNNDNIYQLFPDIELCIQILISSIISPNDMISDQLNYKAPNIRMPATVKQAMLTTIESHINKYYNLNSKLGTILKEALFTKGAYIEAIIPEASLDDVISQYDYKSKVSIEEFLDIKLPNKINFLGRGTGMEEITVSTEEFNNVFNIKIKEGFNNKTTFKFTQEDLNITITDNPNILLAQSSILKNISKTTKDKVYKSSIITTEDHDLDKFFRDNRGSKTNSYLEIKTIDTASRESIGRPMVLKLPVESVIPVHVVNDPSKHLGYFIILDTNGSPITESSIIMKPDDIYDDKTYNSDRKLDLVAKATKSLLGMTSQEPTLNNLESVYSKIVEDMIMHKLKNGMYGDLVTIKDNADVFRVMFQRSLRAQHTRLLFLPSELVAWYAFDYRDNGTGKSLIEKASVLFSIRAILLFTKMMASIKNSTTVTKITATLDELDPNPSQTAEKLISESLVTRRNLLPVGLLNTNDMVEWAQRYGMQYKFIHPGLPNIEIDTEDVSTSKVIPDDELDANIREFIIMSFGLTPEIVEAGYASDFATSVVAKNLLLAKRVTQIQQKWIPMLISHIRKLMSNDMLLINNLSDIIKNNITDVRKAINKTSKDEIDIEIKKLKDKRLIDYVVSAFINETEVYLPKPETFEANNAKQAFDDYKTMIEETTDIMFNSSAFTSELVGDQLNGKLDTFKAVFQAMFLKKWITDNNYLPELTDFLTKDDEGKPVYNILDEFSAFVENLAEFGLPFYKDSFKTKTKIDNKFQKLEDQNSDTDSSDYESYDNNDENTDTEETETTDDGSGMADNEPTDNTENADNELNEENQSNDTNENQETNDNMLNDNMNMNELYETSIDNDNESSTTDKENEELDKKIKEAKLEKELAYAEKAKADAIKAKKQADTVEEDKITNTSVSNEIEDETIENNDQEVNDDPNGETPPLENEPDTDEEEKNNEIIEEKEEGENLNSNESKFEQPLPKKNFTSDLFLNTK